MKQVLWILLLLLPISAQQSSDLVLSATSRATAHFYQSSGVFTADVAIEISVDGTKVCTVRRGRFCEVELEPGKHAVQSSREWPSAEFNFEPGKTYYFRLQVATVRSIGYLSNLALVSADTAEFELRTCTSVK